MRKKKVMPPTVDYHEWLVASLKDKKEAEAYLNEALRAGERRYFLKALRNVVEAQGGMAKVASKAELTREALYRMLSEDGNPEWESINRILAAIGSRPTVCFEPSVPKVVGCAELRGKSYSIDRRHKKSLRSTRI